MFLSRQMTTQIHGHEVIEMMTTSNEVYTTDSLIAALGAKFGAEARFHTCSADDMDAGALIEFLTERGKFSPSGEGFRFDPSKACRH